jgi:hypothetical protein
VEPVRSSRRAPIRDSRWVALGLSAIGAFGVTSPTQAQEPEEETHIEYSVPLGCPSEDAFLVQVRARTSRFVETGDAIHARTFFISIARSDHAVSGHLVVRSAGGEQSVRDVAGNRCEDVVAAMALIVALDLDPNASTSPFAPPTASSQQAANVPGAELSPEHARASTFSRWSIGLGIHAALDGGLAPRPLLGASFFVEADGPPRGLFVPTVRVAFERATSAADAAGHGPSANFVWTAGMVEACPARWTSGSLGVSPCIRVEGGLIEAAGANIDPARSDRRPWLAAGIGAEGRWFFFTPLFLDAEVGARFPLVRTRYFFQPNNATLYDTPLVGWTAGAGIGMLFL